MVATKPTGPKVTDSEGRALLEQWLREHKVSKHAFALRVAVTQQAVTAWLEGTSRPNDETRGYIKLVANIDPSSWDTAEDAAKRADRAAKVMAQMLKASQPKRGAA